MSDGAPRHPLIPPRAVDPAQDLPALELEVLERWRERDVFRESLRARVDAQRWVFYEGPPTANGPPGSHHVLARVFKDIYPRFQTMRGRLVERKGGWDCHGLPVEIAVEQELGFTSKADIERYGIAKFNAKCRESVFAYVEEWDRLTERIGFWIDLDDAYRTLDESYIESVWWALAEIDRRGLLYEGHKVVPYCYRCGTALSSHEVALGYQDVVDRSVYVRLPVNVGRGRGTAEAGAAARRPGDRAHPAPQPGVPAARGRRAADLDDHAVDAAGQRRRGGRPGDRVRAGAKRRSYVRAGRGAGRARARRGRGDLGPLSRLTAGRWPLPGPDLPRGPLRPGRPRRLSDRRRRVRHDR